MASPLAVLLAVLLSAEIWPHRMLYTLFLSSCKEINEYHLTVDLNAQIQ